MSSAQHRYQPDALTSDRVQITVTAFVQDDRGRILLRRRSKRDPWTLPGGAPNRGEPLSCAIARALAKQAGISVEVEGLVGIYRESNSAVEATGDGPCARISVCMRARPVGPEEPPPTEQAQLRWIAHHDLQAVPVADSARQRIGHALQRRPVPYLDGAGRPRSRRRTLWPTRRR